jgi:hypothetical protein
MTHTGACAHAIARTGARPQLRPTLHTLSPRHVGVQRLEVLVAVMLARERRALANAQDGGCTELAAALATLPSGVFESVAEAVAALGRADARGAPGSSAGVADAILRPVDFSLGPFCPKAF